MTTPLLGDPASLSALAGALRRTAAQLAADAADLTAALAKPGWDAPVSGSPSAPGPLSRPARRGIEAVAAQGERIAAALDDAGGSLQSAATDLAAAIAPLRELERAALAAGLAVRDGSVTGGWGITGPADPGSGQSGAQPRERLQERLHGAVTTLGRQRARSAADCVRAAHLLQEAAAALRGRSSPGDDGANVIP